MNIGNKLLNIRRRKQLSIEDVESNIKVKRNIIRRWEKGRDIPSIDKLILISKLYNISLEELLIN